MARSRRVIAAITPWNYPLMLAAQKVAPALAAGCCVVPKPAEQTPLTSLRLPAILAEAGTHYGVSPMAIARASLMGQPVHLLSPLVPSTYLLVSLAGIDMADHQHFMLVPTAMICAVMTLLGMAVLAFTLMG